MKTNRLLLGLALLVAGALPTLAQVSNDNEDGVYKIDEHAGRNGFVPGQVLVKFKDETSVNVNKARGMFRSVDNSAVNAVLKEFNVEKMDKLLPGAKSLKSRRMTRAFSGEMVEEHDLSQLYLVETDEAHAPQTMQLVDKLKELDEVEYAEPNYKVYITDANIAGSFGGNPFTNQQWYLDDYGVKQLWNKPIINPKRPVIAILDTGVDMTHPDLAPNLWTNTAEAEGEADYDNDGNGFKGDVHGWDFINNTPNVKDFNMHGTHVAGIAAAANNGIGIIGANPMALIMPISVLQSDGTGDVATIVKGIDYAVKMGADVLNLSLGTYFNSRALRQALEKAYQTAVIVAAAGNDATCINTPHHPRPCYGAAPMFPAAYSFVLGVQATQKELNIIRGDYLASFSNYDDDGNTFSLVTTIQDPDGFNYELSAPGTNMLSTIPGGKYKVLQGTSMAAPLVAGAISALKMVKQYDTQEILWGDLLHTSNIAQAYAVTARPAELDLQKILYRDKEEVTDEKEEDYNNDGRIDAGETVYIYPVIRTTFGRASNIKMYLEMGDEFEDPTIVQIITDKNNQVNFGHPLDAYGKGISLNPLKVKIADNVANGRHIKMKFVATCDETNVTYESHFTMVVDNIIKIGGAITSDITLTPDKEYAVSKTLLVTNNATLTILPGTTLRFMDYAGLSVDEGAHLVAVGEPGNMITFAKNVGATGYLSGIKTRNNEDIEYAIFNDFIYYDYNYNGLYNGTLKNCIIKYNIDRASSGSYPYIFGGVKLINSVCIDNDFHCGMGAYGWEYTNIVNNWGYDMYSKESFTFSRYNDASNCNIINLNNGTDNIFWAGQGTGTYKNDNPNYYGSSREYIVRKGIWDVERGDGFTYWDPASMRNTPVPEAHGIVWKVVVNGKDAQDEYEDLAPLGVGKHKFEVYFSRPMNKEVAPQISFGVRDPWTQNTVSEDGSWNEEGTIYTAYKTITGKTKSDGVNRIYVYGAEDNEFFECPYEKTRFNMMINAAGSMATGFAGEAKMGRVELTWNNENNDFEDAMGFNIYRFNPDEKRTIPAHYDEDWNWIEETEVVDTICINQEIVDVETTEYTDYDVIPGQTYYYMYKVLSTDLKEYDVSNIVAVTPLTSERGDANGSGDVDVADVITTVNYAAGMKPVPFIFEAADMNTDLQIDILDVIGIIQRILNPGARSLSMMSEAIATYTVEDGVLYVESPVALGGVQVQLNMLEKKDINVVNDLDGFEHTSAWLTDNDYIFLAYNMNGKTLSAGKHALLNIGNADISSIRLSNAIGHNVNIEKNGTNPTGVQAIGAKVFQQGGVFNMNGQKVTGKDADLKKLPKGVYIINGEKVVK